MILPGSYANGFAPRDGQPLYPELWKSCVFAAAPSLGPTGLTLRDWSGGNKHCDLTNMDVGTDWVTSQGRWALDLDGTNDHIATSFTAVVPPYSVSCWFYPTRNSGVQRLVSFTNGAESPAIYALLSFRPDLGGVLSFQRNDSSVDNLLNATVLPVLNSWNCATVVVRSIADVSLYLHGGNAVTSSVSKATTTATITTIGAAKFTAYGQWFAGAIDDVRIYNAALSENTVRLLALRRGIAYERAPRRRASIQVPGFKAAWLNQRSQIIGGGLK